MSVHLSARDLSSHRWIGCFKRQPRRALRLFCFPYAGGSASVFRDWQDQLPDTIEVCPIQLPGRGARIAEAAVSRAPDLVARLADSVQDLMEPPFAFFGHSMGALLAFELARAIRDRLQLEPSHLFVSARPAPHLPRTSPPTFNLPDDAFAASIRVPNGDAATLLANPEALALLLPMLRADFELVQTYSPAEGPPLACPITALGGLADTSVPREDIVPWQRHTTARCVVIMLKGDHFFIDSSRREVLWIVSRALADTIARHAGAPRC